MKTTLARFALAFVLTSLSPLSAQRSHRSVPFGPGEQLTYDVKFGLRIGSLNVGTGVMQIADTETIRGHPALHGIFRVNGGRLFFSVNDTMETWMDRTTLNSLRFVQRVQEGHYRPPTRRYEIYPDRALYVEENKSPPREHESTSDPLDDASFLYFLRTIPLEIGKTYEFKRYFRPDRNPVVIKVLGRERITVPAGTFDAIIIQPTIHTTGIFSEDGEAKVWLSDDDRRILLQLKSKLSFGSLNLYLKSYSPATPAADTATH